MRDTSTSKRKAFRNGMSKVFEAQEKNKKSICRLSDLNKPEAKALSREQLIVKYAGLVRWVVSRLPVTNMQGIERDDLIGYGTIGLIEAVDRYDASKNSSFESFAITRIRGSIYDQLRAADWLTRGARKKVKDHSKAVTKLEFELGRTPTDDEVTKELGINKEELRTIKQCAQYGVYSLDETKDSSEDGGTTLAESISSDEETVLDSMQENELLATLSKAIDGLPEREKTVIGLYHYNRLTFKEIAHVMSFSESRASQLHARAISLLKSKMVKV